MTAVNKIYQQVLAERVAVGKLKDAATAAFDAACLERCI